ncbi:MAG: class I SAM-dependent methyltransferase [Proteobacteria bacterium]|nr:class I SAM-dependent methyltransferase [Pseudomonadota bacterium]
MSAEDTTHFGYREVPEDEKSGLVGAVFDSVASRYDLMNDLMSVGIHRLWKIALMDWLKPRPDMQLLDVGGGTGDIAFQFLERGGRDVTVCDRNAQMLSHGRDRAIDKGLFHSPIAGSGRGPIWVCGDAEELPMADNSVDAYVTGFCLRNVTRIDKALFEARRVLRPGGRYLCLEFSHIAVPALEAAYDAYSFRVLPALGQLVAGDREAYQYLAESIRQFPNQAALVEKIETAGLSQVSYRNLSGGIVALHSAWRI